MDPIALDKIEHATCKTFEEFSEFLGFNDVEWENDRIVPLSSFPDNLKPKDMIDILDEIIHFYRKIKDLLPEVNPDFLLVSHYFDSDLPSLLKRYIILHHKYWKYSRENCLLMYQFIRSDYHPEILPDIDSIDHFSTLEEWRLHINTLMIHRYKSMFQIAGIDLNFLQSKEV
jgi:hypothetical protein